MKNMQDIQSDKNSGGLALIPQIFYDIIARILPGLIIIFVCYLLFAVDDPMSIKLKNSLFWFSSANSPNTFIFFSFMLWSYVISSIVGQLAAIVEKLFKKILDIQFDKIKQDVLNDFNNTFDNSMKISDFSSIAIMYDYIRLHEPGAGARLVKLRAEVHANRNTFFGLFLIAVYGLIYDKLSLPYCIYIFLLSFGFIITYYKRRRLYLWGLCNHWFLLRGNTSKR